jgi:nitrate reductase NapAB chaperone NapD
MSTRRRRHLRPVLDQLDDRCLLSGLTPARLAGAFGLGLIAGLTPARLTGAYGLDSISFSTPSGTVTGDGSGETIALIEAYHDPYIASDLATFDQASNLPAPPALIVADQAGDVTNAGWALEESLDVEWAHAIAPAANILVVEAQSQSRHSLITAVNAARNTPGVVAISMSWGFSETANESSYNSIFTTPAGHQGITFLAASGDSGPQAGAEWPSVSPSVVAVGGTTLNLSFSGQYQSESAWIDSSGGFSQSEKEPGYQRVVQETGKRSTPDVAFDGDPNTGVRVYQTSSFSGQGSWEIVGGTSLGTPAWAAIIAIVDQGRALEGKGSLDGATQTLPALYSLPSTDFNAIPPLFSKTDDVAGAESANTSTGLGTPIGPSLVADLVASSISTALTTSKARIAARTQSSVAKKKVPKAIARPEATPKEATALNHLAVMLSQREVVTHAKPPSRSAASSLLGST